MFVRFSWVDQNLWERQRKFMSGRRRPIIRPCRDENGCSSATCPGAEVTCGMEELMKSQPHTFSNEIMWHLSHIQVILKVWRECSNITWHHFKTVAGDINPFRDLILYQDVTLSFRTERRWSDDDFVRNSLTFADEKHVGFWFESLHHLYFCLQVNTEMNRLSLTHLVVCWTGPFISVLWLIQTGGSGHWCCLRCCEGFGPTWTGQQSLTSSLRDSNLTMNV